METHDERLYGGTNDGRVLTLFEGTSDEGEPIEFTALYGYNYLGNPGNRKHITAAQVLTTHSQPDYINITGYADFEIPTLVPLQVPPSGEAGTWSLNPETPPNALGSYWDDKYWASGTSSIMYKGWHNVSAFGYSVALLVRFAKVNESVVWQSTNLRFSNAGAN